MSWHKVLGVKVRNERERVKGILGAEKLCRQAAAVAIGYGFNRMGKGAGRCTGADMIGRFTIFIREGLLQRYKVYVTPFWMSLCIVVSAGFLQHLKMESIFFCGFS